MTDNIDELVPGIPPPTDPSSLPLRFIRTANNLVLALDNWAIIGVLQPEHQQQLARWLVRRVSEDQ